VRPDRWVGHAVDDEDGERRGDDIDTGVPETFLSKHLDVDADLFPDLPQQGMDRIFSGIDVPAGRQDSSRLAVLDEQHPIVVQHDRRHRVVAKHPTSSARVAASYRGRGHGHLRGKGRRCRDLHSGARAGASQRPPNCHSLLPGSRS